MALSARRVPLTRETVYSWLQEYDGQKKPTKKLRDHLTAKLTALGLENTTVDTSQHEAQAHDETSLVDMILADLDSYA